MTSIFLGFFIFVSDCICSAFNAKGLMQCPNCRNVEEGKWLYANSYNCPPEVSMDEFTHEEEISTLNSLELVKLVVYLKYNFELIRLFAFINIAFDFIYYYKISYVLA